MSDDKTKALAPRSTTQELGALLNRDTTKAAMASLVPRHLNAERLTKVALNCVAKTPALQGCSVASLYQCVITASELGLEPGGALGHAYLVPYGQTCTLIIGYRGLVELMRRSGDLSNIRAVIVRKGDRFDYEEGLSPKLTHKPVVGSMEPMELVYAVATLKDGSQQFELMSRAQVEAIRAKSKAGKGGPWVDHFDEMAKKTVIRRISKLLPMSSEVADAIEKDGDMVDDFGEVVPSGAEETKKAVKRKLNIADVPPDAPVEEKAETPPEGSTPF